MNHKLILFHLSVSIPYMSISYHTSVLYRFFMESILISISNLNFNYISFQLLFITRHLEIFPTVSFESILIIKYVDWILNHWFFNVFVNSIDSASIVTTIFWLHYFRLHVDSLRTRKLIRKMKKLIVYWMRFQSIRLYFGFIMVNNWF
jgi:hypothetical protein